MSPEHTPKGEPCSRCGLAGTRHRKRERHGDRHKSRSTRPKRSPHKREPPLFLGIDGEGQGRSPHRYVLLAVSDEQSHFQTHTANSSGLTSEECLEFICSLPPRSRLFAFSFQYDLTKILQDLPDALLYNLFRPEERKGKFGAFAVLYHGERNTYRLNLLSTRFSVQQADGLTVDGHIRWGKSRIIHDIWRFYGCKFTTACTDWKVGTEDAISQMRLMKDKRAEFDKESPEAVLAYCYEECRCMAELARKLIDAHTQVGLLLKNYFGAGSSAAAMLDVMGIKRRIKKTRIARALDPAELQSAIASAFFGGRFEHSRIGLIEGPVYSYDIASAYPYQLCFLPCFAHGHWRHTTRREDLDSCRTALVRYSLAPPRNAGDIWAPFPFRLVEGSIVYPRESGGGWLWAEEFLVGERVFPNAHFLEAWTWHQDCDCVPFKDIPHYYRERVRIGKEGPGIVIKLGVNSCYGKCAQSAGGIGQFTDWCWAGLITSGCRAQVLECLGSLENRDAMVMVATDGVCSTVPISFALPKDTGTFDLSKPLGGWEEKILPHGLFLARPGVYFQPSMSAEEMKHVRGRGVGRGAVISNWKKIVDAYERGDETVHVTDLSRFIGAKTGISRGGKKGAYKYKRSPDMGNWIPRPVEMSFNPLPKREGIQNNRLGLRSFPSETSLPYVAGLISPDGAMLKEASEQQCEQPDGGDFADYNLGDENS